MDRESRWRRREAVEKEAAEKHVNYSQGIKGYWASMTPEQRSKEMRRRAKVSLAKGHKAFPSLAPGKKKKRTADAAKQRLFQKRSTLRKQGVPEDQLPPLPGKAA
jgi:hypothetical protein